MPTSLGYPTWDEVPTNQNIKTGLKPNVYTPEATNDCLASSLGAATPNGPSVTGSPGPGSSTISWGAVPADVNHTVVTIQQWSPSLRRYGAPVNRTLAGRASSTRLTGLMTGRPYRFSVAEHNAAGYSAWSTSVKVTPAGVPMRRRGLPPVSATCQMPVTFGGPVPSPSVAKTRLCPSGRQVRPLPLG